MPVIDMHTHLRNKIPFHTKIAFESGIETVLYMPNTDPALDNLERIEESLKAKRYCNAYPVSAITKGLEGKEPVDIEKIRPYVVGFSDNGNYLEDLDILAFVLKKGVLVLAHIETAEHVKMYLETYEKVGGALHFLHMSLKSQVERIKEAKQKGLKITAETCPHYLYLDKETEDHLFNPPLGDEEDIKELKKGLFEGTIDCLVSDYAPLPRETGFAGFRTFIPLCRGLVLSHSQYRV